MKKIIFSFIIISLGFTSCDKEPQLFTKTQIQQKIDSITGARVKELDAIAQKDLEYRITIEVKVKADSIVNAKMQLQKKDTSAKAKSIKSVQFNNNR